MRALLLLLLLPGCLMRGASTDTAAGEGIESPRPTIILRQTSWIDDSLAAKRLGRLEIVARVADVRHASDSGRPPSNSRLTFLLHVRGRAHPGMNAALEMLLPCRSDRHFVAAASWNENHCAEVEAFGRRHRIP
jgi:hypothetical protein